MPEPVIYFIPNTFTPNGDELNNVFQPIFTYGYDPQSYVFYIYNRWGELIFESHDPKIGWDGTFGGRPQDPATFVWIAEATDYTGKKIKLKGTVVLIRQ